MNKLVLLIGCPGSGKSTLAKQFLEENPHFIYLNADSIRKELYGDEGIQGDGEKVFNLLYSRLRKAIKENQDILIDNTSVRKGHRKKILSMINSNYEVFYKVFKTPLQVCLARNEKRSRVVPRDILINFYNVMQEQDFESETSNIEYLYEDIAC